jgi:hypothetical protein
MHRVDFLPTDRETKSKDGKGCLRCGYNVYEAEKLIAAGRVRKCRIPKCQIPKC